MYDIPKEAIPAGMAYQWVRAALAGEPDVKRLAEADAAGWKPVPWERHKDLFPRWRTDEGYLEGHGLRLMERSAELDAVEREDHRTAVVVLAGLGCFTPDRPADDPRVEGIRRDLTDMAFRRRYREVITATAHALCGDLVSPLRVVMIDAPQRSQRYQSKDAVAPFYGFDEPASVLAWRLFEPKAIVLVKSALVDSLPGEPTTEALLAAIDRRIAA